MSAYDVIQAGATAVFLGIVIARTFYMRLRHGVNPVALGSSVTGLARLMEVLVPVLFGLWLVAVQVTAFSGTDALPGLLDAEVIGSDVARAAGSALLLASIALFLWALASFGLSWRIGIDGRDPGALVTGGVFRYSRNPIYVSMGAFFLGIFLIQGTAFFLASLFVYCAWTHHQVLREEEFLAREYGDAYRAYRAATPRYIGPVRGLARTGLEGRSRSGATS